jgi:hypothetical protein
VYTLIEPRRLVLESRIARLEHTIADLAGRLRLPQSRAVSSQIRQRLASAQLDLDRLRSQHAVMQTPRKPADSAGQADGLGS